MPGPNPNFTHVEVDSDGDVFAHGQTEAADGVEAIAVTLVRQGGAILMGETTSATGTTWKVPVDKPKRGLEDGEEVYVVGVLVHDKQTPDKQDEHTNPVVWKQWTKVKA